MSNRGRRRQRREQKRKESSRRSTPNRRARRQKAKAEALAERAASPAPAQGTPAPIWRPPPAYRLDAPPYDPDAWRSLIWACRQPNRYRFGGIAPMPAEGLAGLTPAGRGARWLATPAGAVLLAPDQGGPFGRWGWLQDLGQKPLNLGVFTLGWTPPRSEATRRRLAREQRLRIEQAREDHARRVKRGERLPPFQEADVPGPALPSPGRLLLALSPDWLREQQGRVLLLARMMAPPPRPPTPGSGKRKGQKRLEGEAPEVRYSGVIPSASQPFVLAVNRITREVMTAGEFAWWWPGSLRAWNVDTARVVLNFLVSAHGLKRGQARAMVDAGLLVWRVERRSPRGMGDREGN